MALANDLLHLAARVHDMEAEHAFTLAECAGKIADLEGEIDRLRGLLGGDVDR